MNTISPDRASGTLTEKDFRSRTAFWILAGFFALLFLTGGSSAGHQPGLAALRPVAILIAGYGLCLLNSGQMRQYWPVFGIFLMAVALTVAHLVPLPPSVWHSLPGRDILMDIDRIAGAQEIARPMTMAPDATLNALYALSVPAAVLLTAIQLKISDQMRLMMVILGLILASGILTITQAAGSNFALYSFTSGTPGVFANRNHQSALLATAFPMLVASSYFAARMGMDRKLANIFAVATGLGIIPLVIVIGSRAGLVLSALAILLLLFIKPDDHAEKSARSKLRTLGIRWVGTLAAIAIMVWATFVASRDVAITRLSMADEDLRYPLWNIIFHDLPNWLPWGSGIGSFADTYQINEPSRSLQASYINHAHNDWLEVIYTAGIPGAVMLILAGALFLASIRRIWLVRGRAAVLARTGIFLIFLLAIASLSDYPIRTPIMSSILALAAIWASSPQEVRK